MTWAQQDDAEGQMMEVESGGAKVLSGKGHVPSGGFVCPGGSALRLRPWKQVLHTLHVSRDVQRL